MKNWKITGIPLVFLWLITFASRDISRLYFSVKNTQSLCLLRVFVHFVTKERRFKGARGVKLWPIISKRAGRSFVFVPLLNFHIEWYKYKFTDFTKKVQFYFELHFRNNGCWVKHKFRFYTVLAWRQSTAIALFSFDSCHHMKNKNVYKKYHKKMSQSGFWNVFIRTFHFYFAHVYRLSEKVN